MKVFTLLVCLSFFAQSFYTPRQEKKIVKIIEKAYDQKELHIELLQVGGEASYENDDMFFVIKADSKTIGYAAAKPIRNNYLNYFPIFIFDHELIVIKAGIVEMNTLKGAEINTRSWLKQFKGYNGEVIRYGKEIDAVSGATLSGLSMVEEIQRIHGILKMRAFEETGVLIGQ